jgi:hypothetical protein
MCVRGESSVWHPGSTKEKCTACSAAVWVTPATVRALKTDSRIKPICLQCSLNSIDESSSSENDDLQLKLDGERYITHKVHWLYGLGFDDDGNQGP